MRKDGIILTSPLGVFEKVKGPVHMVEGNDLRERPNPHPTFITNISIILTFFVNKPRVYIGLQMNK